MNIVGVYSPLSSFSGILLASSDEGGFPSLLELYKAYQDRKCWGHLPLVSVCGWGGGGLPRPPLMVGLPPEKINVPFRFLSLM